jgi:hypothetical protein
MAIQVNGTEVISNSRALNNIASVDATTVAAMSAAGVGGFINNSLNWTFDTSGSFTSPTSGTLIIQIIGGGGGGAAAHADVTPSYVEVTGGAAGGYSLKKVAVTAGQTFTYTVGAGGAKSTGVYNGGVAWTTTSGNAGSTTSITGPNSLSMSATGGGAGAVSTSFGTTNAQTSGSGGVGSGGDINTTGGVSATSTSTTHTNDRRVADGGSVSLFQGVAGVTGADTNPGYFGGGFSPDVSSNVYNDYLVWFERERNDGLAQIYTALKFSIDSSKAGRGMLNDNYYGKGAFGMPGSFGGGGGGGAGMSGAYYQAPCYGGPGGGGAVFFSIFTDDAA